MASLEELVSHHRAPVAVDPSEIASQLGEARFVVIDDDPTGSQSVSDLPVLTRWSVADFRWAFSTGAVAVYIIANTRALDPDDAGRVNTEIVTAALEAGQAEGVRVSFISRSDSTLRGHYPLEPDTIANLVENERSVDGIVIVPAFPDAGRITVDSVHYATRDGEYTPVGQTEFAADKTFGYTSSNLVEWVAEKTGGRDSASRVLTVRLEDLRGNLDGVIATLSAARDRQPIVCDAVVEDDLRRLALALIAAEEAGATFVYRVGPTFVRARIGQDTPEPVTRELAARQRTGEHAAGGLVVVGSHVALTTSQLEELVSRHDATFVDIDVASLLGEGRRAAIEDVVDRACSELDQGDVILATSRTLVTGNTPEESLAISRAVSGAVVEIVSGIVSRVRPSFIITKGGITSSDVAATALEMSRAWVVGPMLPGLISMWRAETGPAQGIPYVVFPGNVGTASSLADVASKLKGIS